MNKNILRIISEYLSDKSDMILADFGCGEMPHKDQIEGYCKEYLAIDMPGNPKASHYINLETNKTEISKEYCDIVWSIQVLEHVENYHLYLQEARRLLKSQGLVIASTHGQWKFHPDPIDYWRWTSDGLKETFRKNGFEIVDFFGSLSFLTTSLQLFQDACLISFPGVKYWKNPFCFIMQLFMLLTEKFSRMSKTLDKHRDMDSDVFFIVAKKT
ncbi:MAG: methyltransferase domain-containing protein [Cyclobacteriaceae bacterium]